MSNSDSEMNDGSSSTVLRPAAQQREQRKQTKAALMRVVIADDGNGTMAADEMNNSMNNGGGDETQTQAMMMKKSNQMVERSMVLGDPTPLSPMGSAGRDAAIGAGDDDTLNDDDDKNEKGRDRDANKSLMSLVWERLSLLMMLLLLQSLSQVILEHFEVLVQKHVIISMFLTMLVGAGGNAGNQAAVRTITGLVVREYGDGDLWRILRKELKLGVICAACLFVIGMIRVHIYYIGEGDEIKTAWLPTVMAICISLFCIVVISVVVGALLPYALRYLRLNIEHAAPAIQVIMDISGVLITCIVCSLLLGKTPQNGAGSTGGESQVGGEKLKISVGTS